MSGGNWLKILCILALFPLGWRPAPVAAQTANCVAEQEPNGDPGTALALPEVEGCASGTIEGADQDFIAWTLSDDDATRRWSFGMSGIPGQIVIVRMVTVVLGADGTTVESFTDIVEVTSPKPGEPAAIDDLFLPTGTYYFGVGGSGEGDYTFTISAGTAMPDNADVEPNDASDVASPVSGEFAVSGDQLDTEDWYAWTIGEEDAAHLWTLTLDGIVTYPPVFEIQDQSGAAILTGATADATGKLIVEDVGLKAGTYYLRVAPAQTVSAPYVLSAIDAGPPKPNQEVEPNGSTTTAFPLDPTNPLRGRLTAGEPTDTYVLTIDDTLAASLFDLKLAWKQADHKRELCIFDSQQTELICKDGNEGVAIRNLRLPAGEVYLQVTGDPAPDDPYLLRIDATTAADPGFEAEPNDAIAFASALDISPGMRGRIGGPTDTDYFKITVTGDPQLWQIDLSGPGVTSLATVNAGNQLIQQARAGEGGNATVATLWDVFLVPGEHFLQVSGNNGDYSIALTPLGPPDPNGEREPNGDVSRSHALGIGQTRTGRLPTTSDVDDYRFFLAAPEHVKFTLTSPPDGILGMRLTWGISGSSDLMAQYAAEPGKPVVYDAFLQPGDYLVTLLASQASASPYELVMEREDPFLLPVDREPNDQLWQAAPLPADFTAHGFVPNNGEYDCYAVPAQSSGSTLSVAVQGEVTPYLYDGDLDLGLFQDPALLTYSAAFPLEKPLSLCVTGNGDYAFSVAIDAEPDVPTFATPQASTIAPRPVELKLTPAQTAVAAYWTEGQRVDAELSITNQGDAPKQLALQAVTSDLTWTAELGESTVNVGPGETLSLPVTIRLLPDARGGRPVRITVAATDEDGALTTGWTEIEVDRDGLPVNPEQAWTIPDELLGGLNVAALSLGAVPISSSDGQAPETIGTLFDGKALPGIGFYTNGTSLPLTVTVQLAGDAPLPITGVVLEPEPLGLFTTSTTGDISKEVEILVSTDGVNFTSVYSGELSPRLMQQSFVFDQPVEASYAQLIIHSNYGGPNSYVTLGEWEVIAQPGALPGGATPFNIAEPKLGGHLVRSVPNLSVQPTIASEMLLEEGFVDNGPVEAGETPSFTVGFLHDRAAQISEIQWVDQPIALDARFETVDISVSTTSPTGPWTSIGTWTLDRSQSGEAQQLTYNLDKPIWARFVRFTSTQSVPEGVLTWEFPMVVRIIERETDDDYRSILGEWGRNLPVGIYEKLEPPALATFEPETTPNETVDQAQALPLGETTSGTAQIGKDVDWYSVEIPPGMNELALTLTGAPAIDVELHVEDEQGNAVDVSESPVGADITTFTAPVEEGKTYYLRIEQPLHSVVFSFDTSFSISNFDASIYAALNVFASEVTPGQENVNFLPFGQELLLDDWQDEPYLLQQALNEYPRDAISSDSPEAIVKSMEALEGQPGAKAILLTTDGETSLDFADEAWELMDSARPRIFPVHIGGISDYYDVTHGMLEDWALVNNGYYTYASGQGDIDVAFDRMATWLRRPAAYTINATAIQAPTPTPAPTATPEPTSTPTPTATPEATATSSEPGSIEVIPPPRQPGEPVLVANNVSVEIVLDTSGSMLQPLEGSTRADVAKATLIDLVTNTIPAGTPLALRIFGQTPDSCETSLAVPLQPLDPAVMSQTIQNLPIVNLVRTPIGESLRQVANDLADVDGPKIIVLVTDGEETCGGDAEAAIRELVAQGIDVHVNIVGFALDDQALKDQFANWAEVGQGVYIDAANQAELAAAVEAAVQAPFRVVDSNGNVVATGVVGGAPIHVPPGTYTIEVLTDPELRVEDVVIESGSNVEVQLGMNTLTEE